MRPNPIKWNCPKCGARKKPESSQCLRCRLASAPSERERFWTFVAKSDGCWLWTSARTNSGYGSFKFRGKTRSAHRISWEFAQGSIPEGLHVMHRCDVRLCVNPSHLVLGSRADNMRDMIGKGRRVKHRVKDMRGELNAVAKYSAETITALRQRASCGISRRQLSEEFGIPYAYIGRVLRRLVWTHLP